MRIKSAIAALLVPMAFLSLAACNNSQDGCYDDGERVSCNDDDDDFDDDDRRGRDDDYYEDDDD